MESKASDVDKAVEALRNGGVIVYPTETVYGLGADLMSELAVKKVYDLKGREFKNPLSIAVKKEQIEDYAKVSPEVRTLIDKYLPGPVTFVLPKRAIVPLWITNTSFIGIRVPEDKIAQELIEKFGPITSTSANLSGCAEPNKVQDVSLKISDNVDFVLDGGEAKYKKPSTVVKITDKIEVLREGVGEFNERGDIKKVQKSRGNIEESEGESEGTD